MTTETAAIVTTQTEEQEAEAQSQVDTALTAEESTDSPVAEGDTPPADEADDGADDNGTNDSSLEAYADFELPEGMTLNEGLLEQATPIFKELGLDQAQAQKLVDFQAQQVQASQQEQLDAFDQLKLDWMNQSKSDKEIGGDKFDENLGAAKEALSKFGTEGLTKLLNDHGVGNHPELIRFMAKVGRLTREDSPDNSGNPTAQAKDRASIMYPNS